MSPLLQGSQINFLIDSLLLGGVGWVCLLAVKRPIKELEGDKSYHVTCKRKILVNMTSISSSIVISQKGHLIRHGPQSLAQKTKTITEKHSSQGLRMGFE